MSTMLRYYLILGLASKIEIKIVQLLMVRVLWKHSRKLSRMMENAIAGNEEERIIG